MNINMSKPMDLSSLLLPLQRMDNRLRQLESIPSVPVGGGMGKTFTTGFYGTNLMNSTRTSVAP